MRVEGQKWLMTDFWDFLKLSTMQFDQFPSPTDYFAVKLCYIHVMMCNT
jgi:hypothetical protein